MQEGKRLPENADARIRALQPPEPSAEPTAPPEVPVNEPEATAVPALPEELKNESSSVVEEGDKREAPLNVETKTKKTARASKKSKLKK